MKILNVFIYFIIGVLLGLVPGAILHYVFLDINVTIISVLLIALMNVYYNKSNLRDRKLNPTFIFFICILSTVVVLSFSLFGTNFIELMDGGFGDGPFYGKIYNGKFDDLNLNSTLKYKNGLLCMYNRGSDLLILRFMDESKETKWAVVFNVNDNDIYKNTKIESIELIEIKRGLIRDKVVFQAKWIFGNEQGYAYIWKNNKFSRFYLSW
jgi:uncharacterized membrane protein